MVEDDKFEVAKNFTWKNGEIKKGTKLILGRPKTRQELASKGVDKSQYETNLPSNILDLNKASELFSA